MGLLLACGLSGRAWPALGTGLLMHGAACRLQARLVACGPTSMLSSQCHYAGIVVGEGAHNQRGSLWHNAADCVAMAQTKAQWHYAYTQGELLIIRLLPRSGRLGAGVHYQWERNEFVCHLCFAVLHRHDVRPEVAALSLLRARIMTISIPSQLSSTTVMNGLTWNVLISAHLVCVLAIQLRLLACWQVCIGGYGAALCSCQARS